MAGRGLDVLVIGGGQAGVTLGHELAVVSGVSVGAAISSCQAL
jgi:cation diffusion facilitator CzcD-associated flavoprotein CzcO